MPDLAIFASLAAHFAGISAIPPDPARLDRSRSLTIAGLVQAPRVASQSSDRPNEARTAAWIALQGEGPPQASGPAEDDLAACSRRDPSELRCIDQLIRASGVADNAGQAELSGQLAQRAISILTARSRKPSDQLGDAYNQLGRSLLARARPEAAAEALRSALAVDSEVWGEEHPKTAVTRANLGYALIGTGDPRAAETLFERAAVVQQRHTRPDPNLPNTLFGLAAAQQQLGKSAEAEATIRRALALFIQAGGAESADAAAATNSLGHILQSQGRFEEAEDTVRRSLAIYRRLGPQFEPSALLAEGNVAAIMAARGRFADAEDLVRGVIARQSALLGEGHPDLARSHNNLGYMLQAQGRWTPAEDAHRRALTIRREYLPATHPDIAESALNLGLTLVDQERFSEARDYYQIGLSIARGRFGEFHIMTAAAYLHIGLAILRNGEAVSAEPWLRRAYSVFRRIAGEDGIPSAAALSNLGAVAAARARWGEADQLYRLALAFQQRGLGDNHPETIKSYGNVGYNLLRAGRPAEAEPFLRTAFGLGARGQDERNPDRIRVRMNLAEAWRHTGASPQQAYAMMAQALTAAVERSDAAGFLNDDAERETRRYRYQFTAQVSMAWAAVEGGSR